MQFHLPELGEGVVEAELVEWLVQRGDAVKHGQVVAEVMTDKATVELPSPITGTVTQLLVEPGTSVRIGDAILEFESTEIEESPAGQEADESETPAQESNQPVASRQGNGHSARRRATSVKAAPAVRRMASQLGIDLEGVSGSGPGERILIQDVAACVKSTAAAGRVEQSVEAAPARVVRRGPPVQPGSRMKLHGLRRKVAERMVHASQTVPHYSLVEECDASELVRLRESLMDRFAASHIKLTYLPFFVKAVVEALQEVPLVNASLDEESGEIVLHEGYHIGIATATANGLVVPVLRDADGCDLTEIAREIQRLSEAARSQKAKPEELRGSTFTITSIGGIGGLISTPIINEPEVGIMGIGRMVKRPVFDDTGNVRPAHIVYLSFSFDHRVIDGAVAAQFSNVLINRLQNPAHLLLPAEQ